MTFNLAKHKWFPFIKPTDLELKLAEMLNAYIVGLETCKDKEEIISIQKTFKEAMMNIALDPECEHEL